MIKKTIRIMLCVIMLLYLNSFYVYAREYNINGVRIEVDDNTILLPDDITHSRDNMPSGTRGSVISFAIADVTNEGNGDMTFMLETYAHKACDEIKHKGFVDVWNSQTESWDTIYDHLFEAKQEDNPDEPLVSLISSFTIKKLEYGKYYRLGGIHQAKLGEITQQFETQTDGVKLVHH